MRQPSPTGSGPAVVALGGGHGLSATLQALRQVTDRLTAVVTVADDGGSSGRLRRELGGLPPGDLRMALAALCGDDEHGREWARVLQTRFTSDGCLNGHAVGNLLIEGVWQCLDDPIEGLGLVGQLVHARGRVLPMSLQPLTIEADVLDLDDQHPDEPVVVRGQHEVATTRGTVQEVRVVPAQPAACPQAVQAILDADYVVLGPGSWFTSVIVHLLVPDLARALIATSARRVLTLNLVPADETENYSASRHLELISEAAPKLRFDWVIADREFGADDPHLASYAASLGARLVVDSVRRTDLTTRHDPAKLAQVFRKMMSAGPHRGRPIVQHGVQG